MPTFPLITFIISGKSWKIKLSPEPVGRIAKTSWPWRTRFKQIFCSSQKDLTYRKCSIVLFVVALMSTWLDNRCPSPSISHSSSMSPVLECYWNPVNRNNPLLRMFTGIPSISPHSPPIFFPLVLPVCNLTCSPPSDRRALLTECLEQASQNTVHFALYTWFIQFPNLYSLT